LLLPLCDQRSVSIVVLQQVVVKSFRDGRAGVVEVVDVARACARESLVVEHVERSGQIRPTSMRDLEDGPKRFATLLALVRGVFGIFHLVGEFEEGVFDVVEAFGRRFAGAG
jgi:hypothetical protein